MTILYIIGYLVMAFLTNIVFLKLWKRDFKILIPDTMDKCFMIVMSFVWPISLIMIIVAWIVLSSPVKYVFTKFIQLYNKYIFDKFYK